VALVAWPAFPAGVTWCGYDEGLGAAKKTGKLALVNFSTSWCVECKKMSSEVFTEQDVAGRLAADYITVKVDGDTESGLTSKYRIFSYPTFVFLDGDGNLLYQRFGSMTADEFKSLLDYVSSGSYKDTKFNDYLRDR